MVRGPQLRQSARQEFEAGRVEYDPENIAKMLLAGRDCLMRVQEMVCSYDKILPHSLQTQVSRKSAGLPYDDLKDAPQNTEEPKWQSGG